MNQENKIFSSMIPSWNDFSVLTTNQEFLAPVTKYQPKYVPGFFLGGGVVPF